MNLPNRDMTEKGIQSDSEAPMVSWLLCSNVDSAGLRESLLSCLEQSFQDFEVVVVANGPRARQIVSSVVTSFGQSGRIRAFSTDVSQLNFSLALGLHLCTGKYVARLDVDDIAYPGRLEAQVSFLAQHPEITVFGSSYDIIDNRGTRVGHVPLPLNDSDIRAALLRGNPFCHPSVMFRRQAVIDEGGYLGGQYAEDYDLWARLALVDGIRFANSQTPFVGYRTATGETVRRSRRAYASVAAAQFRNFVSGAGIQWGIAAFISATKAVVRSRRD